MLAFLWPLFHDAISPRLNPLPEGEEDTGRRRLGSAGRETVREAPGEVPHSLVRYSRFTPAIGAKNVQSLRAMSVPRIIRGAW